MKNRIGMKYDSIGAENSLFSEMFASSLLYLSLISPKLNELKEKMEITQELTDYLKIKD
ncbi:hypothetical protein [Lactobacillus helveticus]|uniref:Uncharacterized protein n=2 Tax=Lactobacillus helveticus TaxID=1587 RepID=A0A8H9F6K7_LACHE|nr:hypothetical protein [Lactobacillus helveticus]GFO98481.1 hypothetical protein LHEH8_02370 [Lactobacillus helveticus]GFP00615.1 hypothetical protein LHEW6_04480 [Lactobacillus helveticus]GFP03931.1 hypothetical protein LHEY10_18600 [Lactobacillus helveticus]GFP04114.1 hypothetical protein LMG22465_01270 [Lactobacillus helveticus]